MQDNNTTLINIKKQSETGFTDIPVIACVGRLCAYNLTTLLLDDDRPRIVEFTFLINPENEIDENVLVSRSFPVSMDEDSELVETLEALLCGERLAKVVRDGAFSFDAMEGLMADLLVILDNPEEGKQIRTGGIHALYARGSLIQRSESDDVDE